MTVKKLPNADLNSTAASIALLKRNLPHMIEHAQLIAEIRKASYDAHIKQGFNAEQSLELCKSMSL